MMLCIDIFTGLTEDAARDVDAFHGAEQIMTALINHLRSASPDQYYGFKAYSFPDGQMLCLQGKDIGLVGEDATLWFRFAPIEGFATSGHISQFHKSREKVITIKCLPEPPEQLSTEYLAEAVRIITYQHPVHTVLLHELTHYFDSKRYPRFHEKGSPEDRAEYYNNPKEFNAYFTNLATPLLRFIRMSRDNEDRETLRRTAAHLGIDSDLKATMDMLMRRAIGMANGGAMRNFFKFLDQRNRRALLKRLYLLHQQAMRAIEDR